MLRLTFSTTSWTTTKMNECGSNCCIFDFTMAFSILWQFWSNCRSFISFCRLKASYQPSNRETFSLYFFWMMFGPLHLRKIQKICWQIFGVNRRDRNKIRKKSPFSTNNRRVIFTSRLWLDNNNNNNKPTLPERKHKQTMIPRTQVNWTYFQQQQQNNYNRHWHLVCECVCLSCTKKKCPKRILDEKKGVCACCRTTLLRKNAHG